MVHCKVILRTVKGGSIETKTLGKIGFPAIPCMGEHVRLREGTLNVVKMVIYNLSSGEVVLVIEENYGGDLFDSSENDR